MYHITACWSTLLQQNCYSKTALVAIHLRYHRMFAVAAISLGYHMMFASTRNNLQVTDHERNSISASQQDQSC